MSCEHVVKDLSLYCYGELSQEEEERVEEHLSACGACSAQLKNYRQFEQAMSDAEHVIADALLGSCRVDLARSLRIERANEAPAPRRSWFGFLGQFKDLHIGFRVPAGAMALLAAGFVAGKVVPGHVPFAGSFGGEATQNAGFVNVRSVEPDGAGKVRIAFNNVSEKTVSGSPDDPKIRQLLLVSMKDDSNAGLRVEAVGIIKDHAEDDDVRSALLEAVQHDPNVGVRMNALEGLKQYGANGDVRKALTEVLLNDANSGVRVKAIDLLTAHKDESIVGPLQHAMQKEDNAYVRLRMTNALRDMNASAGTF